MTDAAGPIRVLYLIDGLGPGGAQRQLVTLVSAHDPSEVDAEVALYRPVHHFVPQLRSAGVPVHQLGVRGAKDPALLVSLARLIRKRRFDIVHCYLTRPGILARLAAVGTSGPRIVVSERSVDLGRYPLMVAAERLLARRGAAMVVNAKAVKEHVERIVPAWRGRIRVIPNGVAWREPTAEQREAAAAWRASLIGDARLLVAVVARLAPEKNPTLLLDAVSRLSDRVRSEMVFAWVGACRDGEFGERVARDVAARDIARRVVFLPATEAVREVYLGADAVALTSNWEGFPNALLEGLAHGRPAVATSVGDVADLVRPGESGWLVPPADATEMAAALEELAATPAERLREMGRRGSEHVLREYPAERMVSRTLELYRELLN